MQAWWDCFWAWLNNNGVAVTAVITAVYGIFTVPLWLATRRQAMLAKRTFEATNRPYLSVRVVGEDSAWAEDDDVTLQAVIENVGTIPAEVTKWEIAGSLRDLDGKQQSVPVAEDRTPGGDSVFPGDPYTVSFEFKYPGIYRTASPLRFVLTLEYRGVGMPEKTYQTVLKAERTPTTNRQRTKAT